ncbi:hypothetical protein [Niallia taxi]|uniref:hypothetical protein n=1 Tax=Niallia taxi TaxID=2499688 RepID=UPI00300BE0B8
MKKVEIKVEEVICYEDQIVVIQPDYMLNTTFDNLIEKAKKNSKRVEGGAKEFASCLRELGLEVESHTYSFPESPRTSEFELIDIRDKD